MLDEFNYGSVTRISPEAPTPIIAVERRETMIGGAGNVACNIAGLGVQCIFIGVVGEDEAGRTLMQGLAEESNIESYILVDRSRPTTRKARFVSELPAAHLLRADWEKAK